MSGYIEAEIKLFLWAAGTGAVLLAFYKIFDLLRCIMQWRMMRDFFDLLYWVFAGSAVFAGIYQYNEGCLRLFLFTAVFFGAFLMNSLLKRLIFLAKRGRILIIMENRFCKFERGKQIEKVPKKEKKHKNIK